MGFSKIRQHRGTAEFQKLRRVKLTAVFYATHKGEIPVGGSATYPSRCRIPSLNIAVLYLLN